MCYLQPSITNQPAATQTHGTAQNLDHDAQLMTNLWNILLLLIVMNLFACSDVKIKHGQAGSEGGVLATMDTVHNGVSPASAVIAFLEWYRGNEDRLHQIQLLAGGLEDTSTFYSVDFKATERYLSELKKSGYVSGRFLDELQKHFVQSNEYLKQHPQNDGPAPGFEADLVMKAQDYMDVWENLDSVKVVDEKRQDDKAVITLLFAGNYKTRYYLTKNGKTWLIDSIENAFAEN